VTRLFALAGVDYAQWKAVSRTLLRTDFRAPTPGATEAYSLRSPVGLLTMALVFGLFGLGPVIVIVLNDDVRLSGTITLVYLMFALSTSLLTQHGATMLSAADYMILGPRPVTSRTFFAIRLTNVLFHALLLTTFMAYPPVIAFTLAHGVDAGRGLGAAVAIYAWAVCVACIVVASYAALLRFVGGVRLQRVVAYLQLVIGIAAYGGFFLAIEGFGGSGLAGATMPDSPWVFLLPPSWFAGYIEIAAGQGSSASWVRVALSMGLLAAVAALLQGSLAPTYAEKLAEQPGDMRNRPSTAARPPLLFARGEARAVALLTAGHFRHDLRVRMGVFGVVPLVLIYAVLGMRRGGNPDPFLGVTRGPEIDLLAMSALMFPAIIIRHLESSGSHRAAWIYTVTTADAGRLVLALKNIATAYFLVPFAAVLALLFAWRFEHVGHALAHAVLLTAISHAALQVAILVQPRLPFAHPPDRSGGMTMVVWMFVVLIGGQLLLIGVQRLVYPSWARVAACLVALGALSWVLERLIRRRAHFH
jgi:hypothetical protein